MSRNAPRWHIVLAALWLVLAFQLIHINTLNMHPDEELSYRATNGTLSDTLYFQTSVQDNQAPLWFMSFRGWRTLVGDAEFTSRVFGWLLVALALAVLTQISKRAFGRWEIRALALTVLIGNAFFFTYIFDIRPYPMVMLVAATSIWALQRWLARGTWRTALIYGFTIALLLYVHYLLAFLVVAHVVYVLIVKRINSRLWLQGIVGGIVGLLIWLPWMPHFIDQVVGLRNIESVSGTGRGVAGIGVSTQATTLPTLMTLVNLATNDLVWLYTLVLLIGLWRFWKQRGFGLALMWAVLTPAVYLMVNLGAGVYAPRFVSHALLGFGMLLAAGIAVLPAWWKRIPVRTIAAVAFTCLNIVTFPALIPMRIPFRELFQQVSAESQSDDVAYLKAANETDGFQGFLFHAYLAPHLYQSLTTDVETALKARRIWFFSAHWLDADVQQTFKQIEATHPLQKVIGQCDLKWCYVMQLMEAPPNDHAEVFGTVLPFLGIDAIQVTPQNISAHLWWKADVSPSLDYSFSLRLNNASGNLVAQADGPINHYNTQIIPTSQMQRGHIYIDYRTLLLPTHLEPGSYNVELVVYQPWDNQRLLLPNGDDHLLLEPITIP